MRTMPVRTVGAAACAALVLGATGEAARATRPPSCATSGDKPYSIELGALTGPQRATVTLAVKPAEGCAPVETLDKVQLKTFAADGSREKVRDHTGVAAPGGVATFEVDSLERDQLVKAQVQFQTDARTLVVRGQTNARLAPDLTVASVQAPLQTLTTRAIDVQAEVAEVNGDTAAAAKVTLMWGPTPLGTQSLAVPAGGRASVSFTGVALTSPAPVELAVVVSDVAPAETDQANNSRSTTVEVTELELARSRVAVPSLGGFGAQLNHHVFAAITSAPPASLPDLEAKVKALEPQLVRIFYGEVAETTFPDRMASFVETVKLAQEADATINITYQSAARAKLQPERFMRDFAAILEDLVRGRGLTNVRWVTIQNEPNDTTLTLEQYNVLYRALHAELVARGLRDHIRLMGGDLVEFGDSPNQPHADHRVWWQYMATNMNDILDAYSVHIYWNYWDIPRMEFRLKDVRRIVTEELPPEARKPTYVTEFGVRGNRDFPGKPAFQPGYWQDGTMMARTNIAAFQQLWFNLVSAQLGFVGAVKWDAYWGRYDNSYNASHWLIGPAEEGWPLMPAYHAFRLLLQTTQRGWQVIGVDPWAEDDWKVGVADQPEKEVTAYAGPNGELTLIGLDTHGRDLNSASTETPSYSIGGLPPHTTFNLALWNASANGQNAIVGGVTANASGVVRFEAPLHAAFALTTVPLS
jgi:hypothetical protein